MKMIFWFACLFLPFLPAEETLEYVLFQQVFREDLSKDAIVRDEIGFENDFLLLHSLIRQYKPFNLFEIGTCEGKGTYIAKNAIGDGIVYSLELPPNQGPYNLSEEMIGAKCRLPFIQLYGNSLSFNYSDFFPIDAWFIDGWHDYTHVRHETFQALLSNPKLIIWHDTDIPEVFQAVTEVLQQYPNYKIFRVIDTRIAYALKRDHSD